MTTSPLPTFLVIGPPRCGTTRLYRVLQDHQDVFISSVKEPCYFAFKDLQRSFTGPGDNDRVRDWKTYNSLFEGAESFPVRGEASPLYLWHPEAPKNIHEVLPGVRLIAILRNPVERAISHFNQHRLQGREDAENIETAIEREQARRDAGWSPFWFYKNVGMYGEQIPRYLSLFPRENLRFYFFEQLQKDPECLVQDLACFLGLSSPISLPPASLGRNSSGKPRSLVVQRILARPNFVKTALKAVLPRRAQLRLSDSAKTLNLRRESVPPEVRRRLLSLFEDTIRETARLLETNLEHWLRI